MGRGSPQTFNGKDQPNRLIGHILIRARSNGKRLGRPRVDPEVEEAIGDALRLGNKGIRKIAREMGVGVSVVQRVSGERAPL